MQFSKEIMNDDFEKWHIQGLPINAAFHHFTAPDIAGTPHDHPFSFSTQILSGGYIEKIYRIERDGNWYVETIHRKKGSRHFVDAGCIHEIIELPEGECWTLVISDKYERTPHFWRFDDTGIYSRAWNEIEFKKYK